MPRVMVRLAAALLATLVLPVTPQVQTESRCTWPTCTGQCEPCNQVFFGTCLVMKNCGPNAGCHSGVCQCSEGFCHGAAGCMPVSCLPGALPVPFEPSPWVTTFASMGPELPRNSSSAAEMTEYAKQTLTFPLVVLLLGVLVAVGMCCDLCIPVEGQECDCLPKGPWLLLGWGIGTCLIVVFGMGVRHLATMATFTVVDEQLDHIGLNNRQVADLGLALNQTCSGFETAFYNIPDSCRAIPFAKTAMEAFVQKAGPPINKVMSTVYKFNEEVQPMQERIQLAQKFSSTLHIVWFLFPLVPLLLMVLVTLAIIGATLVSWLHHDPEVAQVADCIILRCGAGCLAFLIVAAAALAAVYLEIGLVGGAFCMDVDNNLVNIVSALNFTAFANQSSVEKVDTMGNHMGVDVDLDRTIDETIQHYVLGSGINPLIALLQRVDSAVTGLHSVWNDTDILLRPAGAACPGLDRIQVHFIAQEVHRLVHSIQLLIHARNIWPYYDNIFHVLVCDDLVRSAGLLIPLNIIVGLICFPVLTFIAHIDLEKWAHWRDGSRDTLPDHHEDFEGETSDEDSGEHFSNTAHWRSSARELQPLSARELQPLQLQPQFWGPPPQAYAMPQPQAQQPQPEGQQPVWQPPPSAAQHRGGASKGLELDGLSWPSPKAAWLAEAELRAEQHVQQHRPLLQGSSANATGHDASHWPGGD